jgi:zinc/manganese transport system permease protein
MDSLDFSILIPAFIAGLLVLTSHVPFGMKVLARGIIFADLAVAQIAGLGVIVAELLGVSESPLMVQLIAVSSALLGAVLLSEIERRYAVIQEALIGLLFVLAATASILLLSRDVHAGEHIKDLLVGQILWVTQTQLIVTGLLTGGLLLVWHFFKQRLGTLGFYALFAVAVTASVQLVGVYLVFASLIIPALATHATHRNRLIIAYAMGILGYLSGLLLSVWFDLPTGATIVWTMALVGAAGLIWQSFRRNQL